MGSLQSLQSDFLVLGGGWLGQRLWHLGYRAGCAEQLETWAGTQRAWFYAQPHDWLLMASVMKSLGLLRVLLSC